MTFSFDTRMPAISSDMVGITLFGEQPRSEMMLRGSKYTYTVGTSARLFVTDRDKDRLLRRVTLEVRNTGARTIVLSWDELLELYSDFSSEAVARRVALNITTANYQFRSYKKKPAEGWPEIKKVIIVGRDEDTTVVKRGLRDGKLIGEYTNMARTIANIPGGDMTPSRLADYAIEIASGSDVSVQVLDEMRMQELGMNGILSVGKGSDEEAKLIMLEYKGALDPDEAPTILVGKGVTFDSGGINLKPGMSSYEMNMDMSGGSTVIHSVLLAEKLNIKKNIIGLVPAAENFVSGSSYRPGDIITMYSGDTVEVLNTDAEGRLLLADALSYAGNYKPACVIDFATLTGAAVAALGSKASALFTEDEVLADMLYDAGQDAADYVWRMPLWDEYAKDMEGTFSDLVNLKKDMKGGGGSATAAAFLQTFTRGYPEGTSWAHIDIAPRMTSTQGDGYEKGSLGAGVALLAEYFFLEEELAVEAESE